MCPLRPRVGYTAKLGLHQLGGDSFNFPAALAHVGEVATEGLSVLGAHKCPEP